LRCFFKRSLRYLNGWTPSPFPAEAEQRRLQLTADATRERNRVQKLLEHVNVKIGNVLSDVFGVSGQNMLLALLSGEATPEQIAQLARGQAKRKIPQLIEALEGHRMGEHERLLIRSCLRHLACLEEEIEEWDVEILRRMQMPPFETTYRLLQTLPGVGTTRGRQYSRRDRHGFNTLSHSRADGELGETMSGQSGERRHPEGQPDDTWELLPAYRTGTVRLGGDSKAGISIPGSLSANGAGRSGPSWP
jgi:hypothetical protein